MCVRCSSYTWWYQLPYMVTVTSSSIQWRMSVHLLSLGHPLPVELCLCPPTSLSTLNRSPLSLDIWSSYMCATHFLVRGIVICIERRWSLEIVITYNLKASGTSCVNPLSANDVYIFFKHLIYFLNNLTFIISVVVFNFNLLWCGNCKNNLGPSLHSELKIGFHLLWKNVQMHFNLHP